MRRNRAGAAGPLLWLIKGLGPGGAERLVLAQASQFARPDQVIVAYTRPDRSHLVDTLRSTGVDVRCLSEAGDGPGRWVLRLAGLVWEERPAVVHCHSPALAPIARVLGRVARSTVVSTEHNRWPQYRWPTRLANALTSPLDHRRFAVSDGVRETVWRPFRGNVETLRHGVPADLDVGPGARRAARSALGATGHDLVVLTIANLRAEKAPLDLLAAAAIALGSAPELKFVWVGQGPLEAEFRLAIERAGLGDRFVFLGYRADARALLAGADLFALSSRHEGLPVVLMEAQHAGVPVVAPDVGGVAEAVGGADPSGVLVPAGDPAALAQAILMLARDPERRSTFRAAALRRSPRFDGSAAFARLDAVYAGGR